MPVLETRLLAQQSQRERPARGTRDDGDAIQVLPIAPDHFLDRDRGRGAAPATWFFAAGVPARWDPAMLHQWSTGALLPDRSLIAGVHQVPPGHYLLATSGSLRLHRYWDFDYPATGEPGPRQDLNAWAEQFRAAFDEAVRLRLRADVPVGCYLSGGIDSAAVLGFAARHSRHPIRAFTLSFDHEAYDERQLAQEMAALAGPA